MAEIREYEAARSKQIGRSELFLSAKAVRYALSFGGAVIGLINLARIYFALLAPVTCR